MKKRKLVGGKLRNYSPGPLPRKHLPEANWPEIDRSLFRAAVDELDNFDSGSFGRRLSASTIRSLRYAYRRWLHWLTITHSDLLVLHPCDRVTRKTITGFRAHLVHSCEPVAISNYITWLHMVISGFGPERDWQWLRDIKRRLGNLAVPARRRTLPFTSEALHTLSLEVIRDATNHAAREVETSYGITYRTCRLYRDGLLLAFASLLPLRGNSLAQLALNQTIHKIGSMWLVAIEETKNKHPIETTLPNWLGDLIDDYLRIYRPLLPGSHSHAGLWASNHGHVMTGNGLRQAIARLVHRKTGKWITLHNLRHIAASSIALYDPENASAASDLLHHRRAQTTERHYNRAGSIVATRTMAEIVDDIRRRKI